MSRAKGVAAPAWVAAYLRPWWPHAEKTPNGLPGSDIRGTPGVEFEIKTGTAWRGQEWSEQAGKYARDGVPSILVWLKPGMGERSVGNALAIVPLHVMLDILEEGGYAPRRQPAGKDTP